MRTHWLKLSGVALQLLLLCTVGAFELIIENDLSSELEFGDQNVYVPKALEVRGGSRNIDIHGIYLRDEAVSSQVAADPSHRTYRPAFRRISSPNYDTDLYLLWIDVPTQQWVISTKPVVPQFPPNGVLLAKLVSAAASPAYSSSWKVRGRFGADGTGEHEQLPSAALETHALQAGPVVSKATKTGKMGWKTDVDFIVDEARPGTYSTFVGGQKELGCPNAASSSAVGVQGYKVDACRPPAKEKVKNTHRLDFRMSGGDGLMRDALFSWAGFFMSRPYFELRSAANPNPTHHISAIDGRLGVMWAEGVLGQLPVWRITRELGNIHKSQLIAYWKPDAGSTAVIADWPAEATVELSPRDWFMAKKPTAADEPHNANQQQRAVLWTKGVEVQQTQVTVSGSSLGHLNGIYYHVGEYLGDPFFRQAFTGGNGMVMYRGRVIASDMDTWVIGARLGSTQGVQAFLEGPRSRWPHISKNKWSFWESAANTWKVDEGLAVDFQYMDPTAKVTELFGKCPVPQCAPPLVVHCPTEGSCNDCACQSTGQHVDVPKTAIDPFANQLGPAMHGAEVLRKLDGSAGAAGVERGYGVESMMVDPELHVEGGVPPGVAGGGGGLSVYSMLMWGLLIIPLAAVATYGGFYIMKRQDKTKHSNTGSRHQYTDSDVAHAAGDIRRRSKLRTSTNV